MTVGLVVVSHSRALAESAIALAGEMAAEEASFIESAAGLNDGGFGTDAVAISDAVARADRGQGVVVLMDLGSAVLSAEMALELLDDQTRERVLLCPAPLIEGLIIAAVTAGSGATAAEVAAEASAALGAKQSHLADESDTGAGVDGSSARTASAAPTEVEAEAESARFTVSLPHGLHARPAALVVRALRGLDAEAWLRNLTLDTPAVSAASLSQVATLGALRGHEIEISATGAQAPAAVRALLDLANDNFGESAAGPDTSAAEAAPAGPIRPSGRPVPASPGIGIGPACLLTGSAVDVPAPQPGSPHSQRERLEQALTTVRSDLARVRDRAAGDIGETEARIFDAQLLLLDDPELRRSIHELVDSGADAARAWADGIEAVEAQFADATDAYLRARAADVRGLRDQVLRALGGTASAGARVEGVLVADDLTPAQATELDPARTAAVLLAQSSPTAHSAILLRARGIPAVVGAGTLVEQAGEGALIALDGATGEVALDPDEAALGRFRERAETLARRRSEARAHAAEPAVTVDATPILVGANLGSAEDARAAADADVAGLVRTEFCFLGRSEPPTVDEQEAAYRAIAEAMGARRVTLRTLDVGGDKPLDYLPTANEANPFLGIRGIRLSLAHQGLLTEQLEAFVRVAHDHPVDVMFPMVSTVDELRAAADLLDRAVKKVGRGAPEGLRVGVMVEVPAAALKAAAFAPHVDFLSIGTNDLTQYALAAERGNAALATLADPLDPGVLALIAAVGAVAGPDLLVAVCGELAGEELAAAVLLGLGVRELSVTPAGVAEVKQAVRQVDLTSAREIAAQALAAEDAAAVRSMLTAR